MVLWSRPVSAAATASRSEQWASQAPSSVSAVVVTVNAPAFVYENGSDDAVTAG
jgi:hypothetical protein